MKFNGNEKVEIYDNLNIETIDRYIEIKYVKELIDMFNHKDCILWNDEKAKYERQINKKINWLIRNSRTIDEWNELKTK